jgi:hypothetical protein
VNERMNEKSKNERMNGIKKETNNEYMNEKSKMNKGRKETNKVNEIKQQRN